MDQSLEQLPRIMNNEIVICPVFENDNTMYIKNEDAEKFFDLLNNESENSKKIK